MYYIYSTVTIRDLSLSNYPFRYKYNNMRSNKIVQVDFLTEYRSNLNITTRVKDVGQFFKCWYIRKFYENVFGTNKWALLW